MKLSDIKVNPGNPRIIKDAKFDKLKKSIEEFPKMMSLRPIVVDGDNMILGGNMRFKALQALKYKEIPDDWVKKADDLADAEKSRFIVEDNVAFGEWDFDALGSEWDQEMLTSWGVELPGFEADSDKYGTDFSLPDGDKSPFQQITITVADNQAVYIQNAIADIKKTEEYKYVETYGNENSNGNAIYLMAVQWAEQRK